MFTGIIETVGKVISIEKEDTNLNFRIQSSISDELKIDQSVSHDGVCLTVVSTSPGEHTVTAIAETLQKSNIGKLKVNDEINLERCTKVGSRLDGHIVQGHVDQTAICSSIQNENGSWIFTFKYDASIGNITVEKGSITVNGTSLTVFNSQDDQFSVAIIPYTFENTNFKNIKVGDTVNLEFDIIGKYVAKLMAQGKFV
jgi:riboflavin synthase